MDQQLLTTSETIKRAKDSGIRCSRYALNKWISEKAFPVTMSGNRAYIYWPHFIHFITGGHDDE